MNIIIKFYRNLDGTLTDYGKENVIENSKKEDNKIYETILNDYVMTIQEKIHADLKTAILNKDEAKKSLLRVIIDEFNRVDKTVTDEKATAILKKMLDNAKELKNDSEATLLSEYLPSQLTANDLEILIAGIITLENLTSIKDMGKAMNILKTKYSGQYDGKVAGELVKKALSALPA